jgi:hypothetical protein
MDKVQKHVSFNTNTPSSESYKHDSHNTVPFATASRPDLGTTQAPIQWIPGCLAPEGGGRVNRPRREANHLPAPSAEIKNVWGYTSTSAIRTILN